MDYFVRKSHFSLIELSLLARSYEKSKVPVSDAKLEPSQEALTQTMLQMKASEKSGDLIVAIFGEDPVGFLWIQTDGQQVTWVEKGHDQSLVLEKIKSSLI